MLSVIVVCGGTLNCLRTALTPVADGKTTNQVNVAPDPIPKQRYVEAMNVGEQIEVVGTDVDWHPAFNSPDGPDLIWLTIRLRNQSKVPLGVVWANVRILNDSGQELAREDGMIAYLADGKKRESLAPGAIWRGYPHDEWNNYLPMLDLEVQKRQHVNVEVKVIAAFTDKRLGPEKQILSE